MTLERTMLPARGSRAWHIAAKNAYRHPSGLLCTKGSLSDQYPGYEDHQHAVDCAQLYWEIVSGNLKGTRYLNNPDRHGRNFGSYLSACADARIEPVTSNIGMILYLEPRRAAYHRDTGKIFLPEACYYVEDVDVENWSQILPEAYREMTVGFYRQRPNKQARLDIMKKHVGIYEQWCQRICVCGAAVDIRMPNRVKRSGEHTCYHCDTTTNFYQQFGVIREKERTQQVARSG